MLSHLRHFLRIFNIWPGKNINNSVYCCFGVGNTEAESWGNGWENNILRYHSSFSLCSDPDNVALLRRHPSGLGTHEAHLQRTRLEKEHVVSNLHI